MTRFRALLRLVIRVRSEPPNGDWPERVKWEVIDAFDPIEQFAWKEQFGAWEMDVSGAYPLKRSLRSLDFDTYKLAEYWPKGVDK